MEEVRKVGGNPNEDDRKKLLFLITHSPFILDLRTNDDLRSVISFDLNYSKPRQVAQSNPEATSALLISSRF